MNFMKSFYRFIGCLSVIVTVFFASGCGDDPVKPDTPVEDPITDPALDAGIKSFVNPAKGRNISPNGETVSCVLMADGAYTAWLEFISGGEEWAEITKGEAGEEGRNTLRLVFSQNSTDEDRTVELFVQVEGKERFSLASFTQGKDANSAQLQKNTALNTYMHKRLQQEYLWEEYNSLEVDLTIDYTQFLNTYLLKLGDVNVEDGGKYRSGENRGKRFIYSNIQEIAPVTKAVETVGLGFGPIFSSQIDTQNGVVGLSIAYVHQGSPAWLAGMRRGDTIFSVNGVVLNNSNYKNQMNALYYSPSGTYRFGFVRDADLSQKYEVEVTVDVYRYNPVLYSAILGEGPHKIGYLVLENFDLDAQDFVVDIIQQLKDNAITDLILDLRFNAGGAVAQSRWLSGCIAGEANGSKTFTKVVYNDGRTENWTFDYGYNNDTDPLGKPKSLGLDRLFVICSYNTASAAELVINSLRGIDFPVKLIGCRTEGKNVGMTVSETTYNGRRFQFSPVTFWVRNAKDFGDYPDGIAPDEYVNNDNTLTTDDADNVFPYSFSDWGNMDYNIALQWAYCDITGKPRWTHTPGTRSAMTLAPDSFQPMTVGTGMSGNLIYELNNKQ